MSDPVFTYYAWRVEDAPGRYISTFDPMTDEFDVFGVEFDTPQVAVDWLMQFLDEPIPDDYRLIRFTGTLVRVSAYL